MCGHTTCLAGSLGSAHILAHAQYKSNNHSTGGSARPLIQRLIQHTVAKRRQWSQTWVSGETWVPQRKLCTCFKTPLTGDPVGPCFFGNRPGCSRPCKPSVLQALRKPSLVCTKEHYVLIGRNMWWPACHMFLSGSRGASRHLWAVCLNYDWSKVAPTHILVSDSLIPTPCQIRYRSHLWDHPGTGQL